MNNKSFLDIFLSLQNSKLLIFLWRRHLDLSLYQISVGMLEADVGSHFASETFHEQLDGAVQFDFADYAEVAFPLVSSHAHGFLSTPLSLNQ